MLFIKNVFANKERRRRAKQVFEEFTYQFYKNEFMAEDKARYNLSEGIVEFRTHGNHLSNALLISNDGFALTPSHCINNLFMQKAFFRGNSYGIESIITNSSNPDIALIKLKMGDDFTIRDYRLFNTDKLMTSYILQLSRWDDNLIVKRGEISFSHYLNSRQSYGNDDFSGVNGYFSSNIPSTMGDSGGVVADYSGRIIGLSVAIRLYDDNFLASYGLKLNKLLEVIGRDLYR